jgi:hypothetical protein
MPAVKRDPDSEDEVEPDEVEEEDEEEVDPLLGMRNE